MKTKVDYLFNPALNFIKPGYLGNKTVNGAFVNPAAIAGPALTDVLKWQLWPNPQRQAKKNDRFKLPIKPLSSLPDTDNCIIWLGHASFYLAIGGVKIITDPIFYDLLLKKRLVPMPLAPELIQPIDYVLISHDHRDHFDKKSMALLAKHNPAMEVLLPLKGQRLMQARATQHIKQQQAGWYQEYQLDKGLRIIFLPAYHWGRRGLNDLNQTLWGSFLLIKDDFKLYFSGDSAYSSHYQEIGALFGGIDVALMPIGAYSPSYVMQSSHLNPEESYQAFQALQAKLFIPMHYGSYDLADEPVSEPLQRIKACFNSQAQAAKLKVAAVGEVIALTGSSK